MIQHQKFKSKVKMHQINDESYCQKLMMNLKNQSNVENIARSPPEALRFLACSLRFGDVQQ